MCKRFLICSFLFLGLIVSSCVSRKDVTYINHDEADLNTVYEKYVPKIKPNDILNIVVSAADLQATQPFNQQSVFQLNANSGTADSANNVYMVDHDGYINYPVLGKIKLAGLTRLEAINLLKDKLKTYIVDPGVNLSYTNFRITVIGEVANPGTFTLTNERVSVFDAVALAGDIGLNAKRDNVQIIREEDGVKKIYYIDLTSRKALDLPHYYLQQNDIVYVEPNKSRIQANTLANYSFFVSIAGIIISVMAVLTRR